MMRVCFANATRIDFDGKIEYVKFECEVSKCAGDPASEDEFLERVCAGGGCDVVVTKEVPVTGELIARFPASVKLLVEGGTGFNNINLAAATARGITVCNCPNYSTAAVAQLVVTFALNFSASLHSQMRMLQAGDRSNFTQRLQVQIVSNVWCVCQHAHEDRKRESISRTEKEGKKEREREKTRERDTK